jgi:hypothetical protein
MTDWTPERLRELAEPGNLEEVEDALRAAADQIERLRADERRLDWLDDERFASWANNIVAETNPGELREAIDAAMGGDDEDA